LNLSANTRRIKGFALSTDIHAVHLVFGPEGGFVKRFLVFEKIIVFYPLELLTAGAIAPIVRILLDLELRRIVTAGAWSLNVSMLHL
jgi:hypothetical protein